MWGSCDTPTSEVSRDRLVDDLIIHFFKSYSSEALCQGAAVLIANSAVWDYQTYQGEDPKDQ